MINFTMIPIMGMSKPNIPRVNCIKSVKQEKRYERICVWRMEFLGVLRKRNLTVCFMGSKIEFDKKEFYEAFFRRDNKMQEQYYTAYEKRYQAAYSAGVERWGNSPEDEVLYNSLNAGAPMLLFREAYRKEGVYCGVVNTIEEWVQITGEDYTTPQLRQVRNAENGNNIDVLVPTLPARAKDKNGYVKEVEEADFTVEKFVEMDVTNGIVSSANIYIRKTTCRGLV